MTDHLVTRNLSQIREYTKNNIELSKSHHIFFERLEDFGFLNCYQKFNNERVQTLRHKESSFAWQNDYLFAGKKLYERCISCKVIDDKSLYELSDHNPILAEFDI